MMVSKRNLLFQGLLFRFHVKFQGCSSEFLIRKGGFTTQVQIQELQHHLSQGLTTGIAIVPGTNITREQIHAGSGVSAGRALVGPRSLRFFGGWCN